MTEIAKSGPRPLPGPGSTDNGGPGVPVAGSRFQMTVIDPLSPSGMALRFPDQFRPGESWAEYFARSTESHG